jgi:hypothetical protein
MLTRFQRAWILSLLLIFIMQLEGKVMLAQDDELHTVEVIMYRDLNSWTLFIPDQGVVSLWELAFEVALNDGNISQYNLRDYPAFAGGLSAISTPVCLTLERNESEHPLPLKCVNNTIYLQNLNKVDIFWYDDVINQERTVFLVTAKERAICPAGQSECRMIFISSSNPVEDPEILPPVASTVCNQTLPSRLAPGMTGVVLNDDDSKVNVRAAAGQNKQKEYVLEPLQTFSVVGGPECADGLTWFHIAYGRNERGWIAEGTTFYFVQPLNLATQGFRGINCNETIQEDFENPSSPYSWHIESSQQATVQIQDGVYELNLTSALNDRQPVVWGALQNLSFDNFHIVAEINESRFASGTERTGLWINYQDGDNFLAFAIRSDGKFQIARYQFGYTPLVDWQDSRAIKIGDNSSNVLEITKNNNQYEFYINYEHVATVGDATWSNGRIAFFGASSHLPSVFSLSSIRICRM